MASYCPTELGELVEFGVLDRVGEGWELEGIYCEEMRTHVQGGFENKWGRAGPKFWKMTVPSLFMLLGLRK